MRQETKNLAVKKSKSGLGLFAAAPIKRNKFVIEYTGPLLTADQANERGGKYLFEINSRWTVDGSGRENLARYINHSCRPNCEIYYVGKRIKIRSLKNIKPGEELTYDYDKEYFDEYIRPYGCKCHHCLIKKDKKRS